MPDDEIKNLMEANLELSKENNKILRKLKRYHTRSVMLTVAKFIVVIALLYGAYYYISPFIAKLSEFLPALTKVDELIKDLSGLDAGKLLK